MTVALVSFLDESGTKSPQPSVPTRTVPERGESKATALRAAAHLSESLRAMTRLLAPPQGSGLTADDAFRDVEQGANGDPGNDPQPDGTALTMIEALAESLRSITQFLTPPQDSGLTAADSFRDVEQGPGGDPGNDPQPDETALAAVELLAKSLRAVVARGSRTRATSDGGGRAEAA